jgi:hypothetical protein
VNKPNRSHPLAGLKTKSSLVLLLRSLLLGILALLGTQGTATAQDETFLYQLQGTLTGRAASDAAVRVNARPWAL